MMKRLKLMKPNEATGEIKKIYDEVVKIGGRGWLVPVFGFLANDATVLKAMWTLIKRLEIEKTATPKDILIGIAMVGAQRIGCDRCITFHEVDMINRESISQERANLIRNFEEEYNKGNLKEKEYVGLKFGEKMVLGQQLTEQEWKKVTEHYTFEQIYEMIMIAWIESGFSRYGSIMAQFDESIDWPRDYMPSEHYGEVVTR